MPPKRKHTKTRTGCKTCRLRRIKCDEDRPKCRNCTRREIECVYFNQPEPSLPSIQDLVLSYDEGGGGKAKDGLGTERPPRDDDRGGNESSSSPCPAPPLGPAPPTVELDMKSLELLYHFTTTTYATLSLDGVLREMWRLEVPRMAFSYEFLMHAVLAVSALHLSFLKSPGESYSVVAAGHHGMALELLRAALPDSHDDHVDALYAASALTARYVYACPLIVDDKLPRAPKWIPAFRGIFAIVRRTWMKRDFLPLLVRRMFNRGRDPGDSFEFHDALFDLSRPGAPGELDPGELEDDAVRDIYREATEILRRSWDEFWVVEPREAAVFMWPSTMSDEFVRFIVEQRPRALVLLAHHCVMVGLVDDDYWWIKGERRGMDEIERIEGVLDEKWKHWLDWPKRKILKGAG